MTDFPAAHSMDTDWYAVDREGRVARLYSGEIGSIPEDGCRTYWSNVHDDIVVGRIVAALDGGSLDERVVLAAAREASRDDVERSLLAEIIAGDKHAREVYADWREAHGQARDGWSPIEGAVYIAADDFVRTDPRALHDPWSGILVFASREDCEAFELRTSDPDGSYWRDVDARYGLPHAVHVSMLDKALFDQLWSDGAVVMAFVIDGTPEPHEVGIYEYRHDWGYGPYERQAVPTTRPLHVGDLPEPLRTQISAVRFPVDFADAATVEPEDHVACDNPYRDT